jgi:ATP-dependent Clp protease ATP-binding subunit ClpB
LDDGRLTDNKGRTVNFKNTLVVMTSNIGSHLINEAIEQYEGQDYETLMHRLKPELVGLLQKVVRPEFLNRIDEISVFSPLDRSEMAQIVGLQLDAVKQRLHEQNITLEATKEAIAHLGTVGFDPQYGARPVKRAIQNEVLNALSKEIIAGKVQADDVILLDAFEGELVFRNVDLPIS